MGAGLAADGWRLAILGTTAAAAVLATRIRFAPVAAVVVLCAVSVIALIGGGPARDTQDRAGPVITQGRHGHHRHHHRPGSASKEDR